MPLPPFTGGGNKGSRTIRKAFSSIAGIIDASSPDDSSKQGFVLTSISQGFNCSSSKKSYPKISKP